MFAIRPLSNGQQNNLAITDFDLSLIHKTLIFDSITKNYSMSFTDDVLEKCTLSHFYKLYSQNI